MGAAFFFVIIVVNANPTTQTRGEWRPTSGEKKKSRVAREALLAKHVFFVWFSDFSVTMLENSRMPRGDVHSGVHSRV